MSTRTALDRDYFKDKGATYYAHWVIFVLGYHFEKHDAAFADDGVNFIDRSVAEMRANPKLKASTWARRLQRAKKNVSNEPIPFFKLLALVACAHSVEAEREDQLPKPNLAWHLAMSATFIAGQFLGADGRWQMFEARKRRAIEVGAAKRHSENRAMKAEARAWYADRRASMSKDAAAEAIARKVLPVSFRTVREWLKDPSKVDN